MFQSLVRRSFRVWSRVNVACAPHYTAPTNARVFSTIYDGKALSEEDTNRHRSNAEKLIARVPVIEVDGPTAVCDGGGGALGHPLEYIQLDTVRHGEVNTCKYCGLRFQMKAAHH